MSLISAYLIYFTNRPEPGWQSHAGGLATLHTHAAPWQPAQAASTAALHEQTHRQQATIARRQSINAGSRK